MGEEIQASQPLPSDSRSTRPTPAAPDGKIPLAICFKHTEFKGQYCLGHCTTIEAKAAVECFRKLLAMTYGDAYKQGGGRIKTGLALTYYTDDALRHVSRPAEISEDVRIAGIRASDKFRIFGAVMKQTFYVLWFDRNHEIVPV